MMSDERIIKLVFNDVYQRAAIRRKGKFDYVVDDIGGEKSAWWGNFIFRARKRMIFWESLQTLCTLFCLVVHPGVLRLRVCIVIN